MSDKPVAMLAAIALIAPLCTICILGPVFVFSWLGGVLGGLDPILAAGLAIIAVLLALVFYKRGAARRTALRRAESSSAPGSIQKQ